MEYVIFYSWQSDSPEEANHTFIHEALKASVERIKAKNIGTDFPVVDQGMAREPGSPEVATIMFKKIARSAVFLGDVSLVGEVKPRRLDRQLKKTANPNVLVEMGYAAAYLGWQRVICVMNTFYGKADEQPVDVRNRRYPIDYHLDPADLSNSTSVKKQLVKDIKCAIDTVVLYDHESANDAIGAIDVNCIDLMGRYGKIDYFPAPNTNTVTFGGSLDTGKFTAAVLRLLDLRLLKADVVPQNGMYSYAYHWTPLGKLVLIKLQIRPAPVPALSDDADSG